MVVIIKFLIFILFVTYIVSTWKSTIDFEGIPVRVLYILIGTLAILVLTLIFFAFSKIGVNYPKQEMVGEVRNWILLIFVPLNGFIILPQIARLIGLIKAEETTKEDFQKKVRRFLIIFIILIIFECIYFKSIQNGIINFIELKVK